LRPARTVVETVTRTTTETVPPTNQGIYWNYAQFAGAIKLQGLQWYSNDPAVGGSHVVGQLIYSGSLGCNVLSYVELDASLFDDTGTLAENSIDNRSGAAAGVAYPINIDFQSNISHGRIEIVVADAHC
jgi:hypothetical protein